jgi:hypothetical protein
MSGLYQDNIEGYYQVAEDAAGAGSELTEADLIDFATGLNLIDAATQQFLTGETFETKVLSRRGDIVSTVVTNKSPVIVDVVNRQQSEVELSLLGVERAETQLGLLDTVNIYGVNSREWRASPAPRNRFSYTYFSDPEEWTFRDNFGVFRRHLREESALQAYCFPPPSSFAFPVDDNSGRFPGGFTDGEMNAFWETKRTFRYQPGRVTGFTFGVRMSTGSNHEGELVQWGCRNDYGDGYYFQLERGIDLFIVYRRFNPFTSAIEEIKIPQKEWNGDQVSLDKTNTGWILDLSKVTMFKIEFSWYGAVGAKFLAFVPVDHDEARWVSLHYVLVENQLEFPSLRSAFLKMFIQAKNTAGASSPAFINLYGSSVYIDGGDKGTVTVDSAALATPKNIDSTGRTLLGFQVKEQINGVDNQKAVYPVTLAASSSVAARFDLVFQGNGTGAGESYFYGNGTNLARASSAPISVVRAGETLLTGSFPDLSAELSGTTDYRQGRRVRVTGSGIFNTHVLAATDSEIITDRAIPAGTTSIRLSRMDAYAVASGVIPSGVVSGTVFFSTGSGQWRLGAWPLSSGQPYNSSEDIHWFASRFTGLEFNRDGLVIGELALPFEPYRQASFSIEFPSGTSDTVLTFTDLRGGASSTTLSGITNPWPISLVAEVMDSSRLDDVVVVLGNAEERITVGSGITNAITSWDSTNGLTEDSSSAGGSNYVANKFEASSSDPLSAVLVDTQGYRTLKNPQRVATYFLGANETKQFDLSNLFGPDKMFITGKPATPSNSGALFVVATARGASGVASATLSWEEQ